MPPCKVRHNQGKFFAFIALSVLVLPHPALGQDSTFAPGKAAGTLPPEVEQVITAYGGADAILKHRSESMKATGAITASSGISSAANTLDCALAMKGDKLRIEMNMLGADTITGYDGKQGWTQFGDWVSPASKTLNDQISDEIRHGLPALANVVTEPSTVKVLPKQLVDGKSLDVFRVGDEGKTDTFYADPKTHLIQRCQYSAVDEESGIRQMQTLDFSDYRKCGASLEPFHVIQSSGGQRRGETTIKSAETVEELPDKLFSMPPESEIASLKQKTAAIPFEYDGNQIIVKARLNSGPEESFIVDTGASQTVVDSSAASGMGPKSNSTFSVTAGSKAVPLGYATVSTLSLGDVTLDSLPVLISDLSTIPGHPSGLIGANVLKRFLVTFDFDEKKIYLADPHSVTVPPEAKVVPTTPIFGGTAMMVHTVLDDKTPMNFLVDTGASFSNLPKSLAKPLYSGAVLPVGTIFGLDGQRINIGSIKLQSLTMGQVVIPHPVFTVMPEGLASAGLFSANIMGILGNPIWSQFRTTVDYRNERLILEAEPGRTKFNQITRQIDEADNEYLRTKDIDQALKTYQMLRAQADTQQLKAAEALAYSRIARCHADRFLQNRDGHLMDMSGREYERAYELASDSRNRSVQGQVMAMWALAYLNAPRSDTDIQSARSLLEKALQKAPMDPSIFAAFGTTLLHLGKTQEAEKLLDRALVLDPANWQALWSKYKLYGQSNRTHDQLLVAAQLKHYYPSYPDVVSLGKSSEQ